MSQYLYPSLSNCYVPLSISTLGLQVPKNNRCSSVDTSTSSDNTNTVPVQTQTHAPTISCTSTVQTKRDILLQKLRNGQRDSGHDKNSNNNNIRENIHSVRHVHIESGILNSNTTTNTTTNSGGSSLVEIGLTKVICQVIGPISQSTSSELIPNNISQQYYSIDNGFIYVDVTILPNGITIPYNRIIETSSSTSTSSTINITTNTNTSTINNDHSNTTTTTATSNTSNSNNNTASTGRYNSIIKQYEKDIATNILTIIQSSIPLSTQYAKNAIIIKLTILQDDGCIIPTCTIASIIALTNASIELYDIPTSCTVAIVYDNDNDNDTDIDTAAINQQQIQTKTKTKTKPKYYYLPDPTSDEILYLADTIVTIGYMCNWKEITYWDISSSTSSNNDKNSSSMSPDITNIATNLCYDGCRTFYQFIREHLVTEESSNSTSKTKLNQ